MSFPHTRRGAELCKSEACNHHQNAATRDELIQLLRELQDFYRRLPDLYPGTYLSARITDVLAREEAPDGQG